MSSNTPATIPQSLSFVFKVDNLLPNFDVQSNRATSIPLGFWLPPDQRDAYVRGTSTIFRWAGGIVSSPQANDAARDVNKTRHSAATVFTQHPDTTHILAVNYDATEVNVREQAGNWTTLSFNHQIVPNSTRVYSSLNTFGSKRKLAAPGSREWVPQLVPQIYDYEIQFNNQGQAIPPIPTSAGLIGSIPILLALAAFSGREDKLTQILTTNIRPGAYTRHSHISGRKLNNIPSSCID